MIRFKKIPDDLKERIPILSEVFEREKEISCFYIFGSYAKGQVRPLSDIDIAVLLRKNVSSARYWDYKIKLLAKAAGALKTEEIDLVILNEAPFELRYNILKDGKILFCHNERERRDFQENSVLNYMDTRYLREESFFHLKRQARTRRFGNDQGRHQKDFEDVKRIFGEVRVVVKNVQRGIFKKQG